ncbi:MAG: RNA-binding domain-containing protein [Candidatus Nitrosotenuis sp.]
MISLIDCKIEALCEINPSEDPQKVEQAVSNLIDGIEIKSTKYSLEATSKEIESLAKIHESIQNHNTKKIYYRILNQNLEGNSTWFYLNKQAAFVNNVAVCEHDDESPMGPIKIILHSKNIERVIEWLLS